MLSRCAAEAPRGISSRTAPMQCRSRHPAMTRPWGLDRARIRVQLHPDASQLQPADQQQLKGLQQLQPLQQAGPMHQTTAASAAGVSQAGPMPRPAPAAAVAVALVSALKLQWRRLAAWCTQHRLQQLLIGSDAGAALAAMSVVPLLPGNGFTDLFTNRVFLAGFWAWFTAQTLKIFTKYLKKGVWDLKAIVDSGGMPSSHSALCAGITTAIAYQHGMGSSAFALAVALSSIVMYDAAGVRRHAGKQAEVLNQVIGELLEGHPVSDVKLKEVLGHTPLQVGAGAVVGVLFGIFFPAPQPLTAAAQHLLV